MPFAALLGVAVFIVATKGGREARTAESLLPSLDVTASWLGLGVDQVSLTGHRFTPDGDIFDALQLDRQRLLIGFDTAGARARIEKLAWVASVDIVRDYPGRIDVRVTERTPFAVWRKGEREFLIDRTGRVLQAVPMGSVANLPRLAGDGAEHEAGTLLTLVGRHPGLAQRFASAERVGGRRWRIVTNNGTRLELPAEGEAMALETLAASGELDRILAGGSSVVDLRAKGRIAVRSASLPQAGGGAR
ncbi:MAG: FtsQ-type POTRA domain-containing protein [Hyphomicrobiaceae bacterium]|nr:FtsQ-type POTRA domain-containing protein [Hyphomicrobiaceae bacterium]